MEDELGRSGRKQVQTNGYGTSSMGEQKNRLKAWKIDLSKWMSGTDSRPFGTIYEKANESRGMKEKMFADASSAGVPNCLEISLDERCAFGTCLHATATETK